MSTFSHDRAAIILVEATYFTDSTVAKNWGITQRTIQRYRQRMAEDETLSSLVAVKKKSLNAIGAMVFQRQSFPH